MTTDGPSVAIEGLVKTGCRGFDVSAQWLDGSTKLRLGLSREQFLTLGARRLGDPWEPFGMTVLALRLTRAANGVSELHGHVSRKMWNVLYPDRSEANVPIGYINNGVHTRT